MRMLGILCGALLSLVAAASLTTASAGGHGYYICWNTPGGNSDCGSLPWNYSIPGVPRAYCTHSDRCRHGQVEFTLTTARINALGRYVDTTTMAPTHTAVIYAPNT